MDPDSGLEAQRALSVPWKSYKLIQDPAIRRVSQKVYRYDGVHFNVPDSGFTPVGELRDPRPRRIWSKRTELTLPVPRFKLDEFYVGPIPLKEVTFARLNDNIREPFLAEMCAKFGEVEEMEILFHPKTRKHLGLARVIFTSTRGAKDTVKNLHNTSVMGTIVHAQLDIRGQQRMKYYDLIVSGTYTPQTVPTGGKALSEKFQAPAPASTHPDTSSDIRRRPSVDLMGSGVPPLTPGSTTPCSADTGFSEQRLDTPISSLGGPYTPGSSASSQGGGTPYTPRSGTPFSQDSGFGGRYGNLGYGGGNGSGMSSSYPPQDLLPSSSCSSSAVSSSSSGGSYMPSRFHEDLHPPPQEGPLFHRGRLPYPPPVSYRPNEPPPYPPYPSSAAAGQLQLHSPLPPPPPASQYETPALSERDRERERERDRDSGARYGGGISARRSSYHHHPQEANASSKLSSYHSHHHHHHHSERRDDRGYRSGSSGGSSGSRSGDHSHQRHRNHHHSHSRRRGSRDRDRERVRDRERDRDRDKDKESEYPNNSDLPLSGYSFPSKEAPPLPPHDMEPTSSFRPQQMGGAPRERGLGTDKDYRLQTPIPPPPPPPPPPLPPASVIAAAVAETYSAADYDQESPPPEDKWAKVKRRPRTPPLPPQTSLSSKHFPSSPVHPSITSSSSSPSSSSLPLHSSRSPPLSCLERNSSSPEPDSTNESLPFVYHSSSLDSRIEMLLKEQKAKFSFLASDEEEEEEKDEKSRVEESDSGVPLGDGEGLGCKGEPRERESERDRQRRREGDWEVGDTEEGKTKWKGEHERECEGLRRKSRKEGGGDVRRSPTAGAAVTPSLTSSARTPPLEAEQAHLGRAATDQEEVHASSPADPRKRLGAHTPPTYNGQGQNSPRSSGEDMEISDEDECATSAGTTHHSGLPSSSSSPVPSSQSAPPSQTPDPASSPPARSDSAQHFGAVLPPPPMPSYPPHLPPPPPHGFSLQPPPPPGIPPPLPHMELHPEYPPPIPHHMYDYTSSVELMNQYSGGAPMSFQMQTQMLSRLYQMRMASSNGTATPGDPSQSDYPPSFPHDMSHLHSLPPPHPHHPYLDQEGGSAHFDQDHRYMPPPIPYPYPDPHGPQLPPPHHHGLPPPHSSWPHHIAPPHYPSYLHPPPYGPLSPSTSSTTSSYGAQYGGVGGSHLPVLAQHPHEATVRLVLAALIQEMRSIVQRDLTRKMVENIAFGTFDEWWERKERKAKPFQTVVRSASVARAEEDRKEKEEKPNSRPREPMLSLVDWAKSGGMEGFSLRGALRLPSFKVKRKEPMELKDTGEMKRTRPSTPPDEEDEDSYQEKGPDTMDGRGEGRDARSERDVQRARKRIKRKKPFDLDSEGEETSDASSSDKEDDDDDEDSDKEDESEDEALSGDSDDESISSSSSESSSSSSSSSTTSSSDEEEDDEEEVAQAGESEGIDTMDESTMDSAVLDVERDDESEQDHVKQLGTTTLEDSKVSDVKAGIAETQKTGTEDKQAAQTFLGSDRPPSPPPPPRPSSPIMLLPPLKKRRKTVSFSTEESDGKAAQPSSLLAAPASPVPCPAPTQSLLLSPVKAQPPDSILTASSPSSTPATPPSAVSAKPSPMLLPFASKPGEGSTLSTAPSPGSVLTVPPPIRSLRPDEPKKSTGPPTSPQMPLAKSPPASKRGVPKETLPKAPALPAPLVCQTVQNLPPDHASMVRMAYEEPTSLPPVSSPPPAQRGRPRGRSRTSSVSAATAPLHPCPREDDKDQVDRGLKQRLKEQLVATPTTSAPPPDLSVLADVALKLEPETQDSEETETSDEAEEQKQSLGVESTSTETGTQSQALHLEGQFVWLEHNYSKPVMHTVTPPSPAQKKTKADIHPVILSPDISHHAISVVLEAPEEVIGEVQPATEDAVELHSPLGVGLLGECGDAKAAIIAVLPTAKQRGPAAREVDLVEEVAKGKSKGRKKRRRKEKEEQQKTKKQKEMELEEVDVEQLEAEALEESDESAEEDEEEEWRESEDVRKSERLLIQEAKARSKPKPQTPPKTFELRSEFEQMTILYDIWNSGLDMEDMQLLKMTYERLLQEEHSMDWLNDTHWVPHTITNIPNPRRKRKNLDEQLREHVTGCARSEGYYAISRKEKDIYLDLYPGSAQELDHDNLASNRVLSERRSEQRRLLSAIGTQAVMDSDLLKLNQLKFRKKKLRFGRSRIHEWGLFAMEPIAADEMVIEYVGQNIRQMVADNREKRYAQEGIGSSYLFRVDHDTIIDATKCGNLARFINHCCTPNCYAKVITIESQKKIVIYSKQPIGINEEITYDYKFPIEENKIPCLCGTENCRGTLN
ncbi:histone-lysine N-methyltransferase SETD1A isoform X2 [Scleropages formosus]|uniref:histone-lysine N-methyltransferase SETD1A isoform X2 n=1 Tax=Scleropages formosus TaxID=113540 RepID=UPI0010FA75DD|nr:histone-lysine N-methyltransferase SETD1A-like isoform X2 [Scleropages formosus]